MRYVIIMLLASAYFNTGTPCVNAYTHHFLHGNLMHLAANALSIWYVYRRWNVKEMVLSYIIATASFFISPVTPIGFSNIIFATIGLRTPPLSSPWWRYPSTIIFLAVTAVMFFMPNVSAVTHVFSFAAGALYAALDRWFKQTLNDSRRFTR